MLLKLQLCLWNKYPLFLIEKDTDILAFLVFAWNLLGGMIMGKCDRGVGVEHDYFGKY